MELAKAFLEHTCWDKRHVRVIKLNCTDYYVPCCADIPHLDVSFADEVDPHTNPIGTKGLAELLLVGVAAAVANTVFHVTGKRLRDLPITLDRLMCIETICNLLCRDSDEG